jgi:hypothetical protein
MVLDTKVIPPLEPEGPDGKRGVSVRYDSEYMAGRLCTLQGRPYAMDEISGVLATNDTNGWTARLGLRSMAV